MRGAIYRFNLASAQFKTLLCLPVTRTPWYRSVWLQVTRYLAASSRSQKPRAHVGDLFNINAIITDTRSPTEIRLQRHERRRPRRRARRPTNFHQPELSTVAHSRARPSISGIVIIIANIRCPS